MYVVVFELRPEIMLQSKVLLMYYLNISLFVGGGGVKMWCNMIIKYQKDGEKPHWNILEKEHEQLTLGKMK